MTLGLLMFLFISAILDNLIPERIKSEMKLKFFLLGSFVFFVSAGTALADFRLELADTKPSLIFLADSRLVSADAMSVDDLGFSQDEIKSDLSQKDLDTRESMLKIHQILGLITAVPMTTEFVLGIA